MTNIWKCQHTKTKIQFLKTAKALERKKLAFFFDCFGFFNNHNCITAEVHISLLSKFEKKHNNKCVLYTAHFYYVFFTVLKKWYMDFCGNEIRIIEWSKTIEKRFFLSSVLNYISKRDIHSTSDSVPIRICEPRYIAVRSKPRFGLRQIKRTKSVREIIRPGESNKNTVIKPQQIAPVTFLSKHINDIITR